MNIRSQSEVIDAISATHLSDGAKTAIWKRIESSLESPTSSQLQLGGRCLDLARNGRRRRHIAEWTTGAAGVAVVIGGGLYMWHHSQANPAFGGAGANRAKNQVATSVSNGIANATDNGTGNGTGNAVGNGQGPKSTGRAKMQVHLPILHSFSNAADWQVPNLSPYPFGVTTVTSTPSAPSVYEEALRPQQGTAELLVSPTPGSVNADQTTNLNAFGPRWAQTIKFMTGSLSINGQTYTVPRAYNKQKLLVLPINNGIVWCTAVAGSPGGVRPTSKLLDGATDIYYTPYRRHGGSLMTGAVKIAAVPHRWMGIDGPTIASAWTGWLPTSDVVMPKVSSDTVMHETFKLGGSLDVPTGVAPVHRAVPSWPTVFMRNLSKAAYYKSPHYLANVQSLTRTNGGFVLTVWFADATMSGRNAGMSGANYYWSEKTRKWTPIDQTYTVQTLPGWTDVGSDGVYEMQPLPVGNGSGNELDVAEMHFDPSTLTLSSIWLGDWIDGPSFVDGNSWVTVLSRDMPMTGAQPKTWTVYTP